MFFVIIHFQDYLFREWIMFIPFHVIRIFCIRRTVKSLGSNSSFLLGVEFRNGKNITVGANTVINKNVLLDGRGGRLSIGNNVDIAQETNIWTLEHDVHNDYHKDTGGDVTIEDYVWIASRVTVLPGVTIGRGAVVASNAVVVKDVEPMTIVGGIPARKIGVRKSNLSYKLKYKPWFR
ncbi:acyltransferase [Fulvivirga kasyanovii]|uniref:Acyltransferase n=1 Tax=Fulvivirga kasyanovii TaxID=396812 RepID=A0ABW9RKY0_9BACT|nr:acyltransferase [Fulvivirga kasyanovii]MTI24631.1 acyltransferase [Fulvivirga kasyanovii]